MIEDVDYIAVVQCHLVKQRCSGFYCEKAFHERSGGFAEYPKDRPIRILYMTCGGCCGKAVQRKLANLIQKSTANGVDKGRIVVQLSSCMTKDNHHSPRCPHVEFIQQIIERLGLRWREDTRISAKAEQRRREGLYGPRAAQAARQQEPI